RGPEWPLSRQTTAREVLIGHHDDVTALAFGRVLDADVLVSGAADGTLKVWDWKTGRELAGLGDFETRAQLLTASEDNHLLAFPVLPTSVGLWDLDADGEIPHQGHFDLRVTAMCFVTHDPVLAAGFEDGLVDFVYGPSFQSTRRDLSGRSSSAVTVLAWDPAERVVVAGTRAGALSQW